MNIETAEKVGELIAKRKLLHSEYTNHEDVITLKRYEVGDELLEKVRILLWQEINKLDEEIQSL